MQKERIIRIFISSPGDVADERDRARQVIESLRRRLHTVGNLYRDVINPFRLER